ncbi:unnamed protein product [Caenorhabditis sp. 36 PRJEB53466]|nr:unnamed protein product [Caenorhabditis sp. 36 PRJEB53466]
MCKLFVAVALLAVAVYAQPTPPTVEQMEAKLVEAGISSTAAAGLVAIGEKYKSQLEAAKGDHEAGKKVFDEIKAETDTYIKTQSSADQTAYAAFVEKARAEHEAHKASATAPSA